MSRSILRAGLSGWNRIRAVPALSGGCLAEKKGLMFQRRPEIFSHNQSMNIVDDLRAQQMHRQRIAILQRYKDGVLSIPKPIEVNSLPAKPAVTENDDFIAVDVIGLPSAENRNMDFPYMICAVSNMGNFKKICKPRVQVFDSAEQISGLVYDVKNDEVLEAGETVKTVQPSEAIDEFIQFVKKHKKPVILTYGGKPVNRLMASIDRFGNLDNLLECTCVRVDARLILLKISKGIVSLNDACRKIMNLDLPRSNPMERTKAVHRLYQDYLLKNGGVSFVDYLDSTVRFRTYLELISQGEVNHVVAEKLSRVGLRIEHLKFLRNEGPDRFKSYLMNRNIYMRDIEKLYAVLGN